MTGRDLETVVGWVAMAAAVVLGLAACIGMVTAATMVVLYL